MSFRKPAESPLEVEFRRATEAMGVSDMFEQEVPVLGGKYRFDFVVKDSMLAVELDSERWHGSERAQHKDSRRDQLTASVGWKTVRFKGSQVLEDTQLCVWTALRAAKGWWESSLEREVLGRIKMFEHMLVCSADYCEEEFFYRLDVSSKYEWDRVWRQQRHPGATRYGGLETIKNELRQMKEAGFEYPPWLDRPWMIK